MASQDILFLLMGAILVLFMHGGFAFLEAGSVRKKNQVHSLVKILVDFGCSAIAYIFIGYWVAYGVHFFHPAGDIIADNQGLSAVKFFFYFCFAAAVPAIISGGIAERTEIRGQIIASIIIVALIYPLGEGVLWNGNWQIQDKIQAFFGEKYHDYAGSGVIHLLGGFLGLMAIIIIGPRNGKYKKSKAVAIPPSNIPFLALGTWILCFGWFGFNVMSAGSLANISGLVALNSLMAMVGGIVGSYLLGDKDPGYVHNGALAGLVAVCAGSDVMHPFGALITGAMAGGIFVLIFPFMQNKMKIDDVLGVVALHGFGGLWGVIACGIFGQSALGGLGGVSLGTQIVVGICLVIWAMLSGYILYYAIDKIFGLRMDAEAEFMGADLAIHKISAYPEDMI